MDREIPKEKRREELRKKIIKYSSILIAAFITGYLILSVMKSSVNEKDIIFSTADKGTIETTISASGKVVPAFEEIINAPISSRITEVYLKGGDSVDVGTPILKLDLQSTETNYRKLLDEKKMKQYQISQLKVNNETYISDLRMRVKVAEMKVNRMKVELKNEMYLDSLGSGTTDRVHQAELNYKTGQLELEQLNQQLRNEIKVKDADLKVKMLEYEIFLKELTEMKRTLDDAQIRSPRKAVLTYINNQIGAQVGLGTQLATISDLSHFKIEGEISDTYASMISVGDKVIVKTGTLKIEGTVNSVTPLSRNGVLSFTVHLNDDSNSKLRSGLSTDLYIINSIKDNAVRIRNSSFYKGKGDYELFVDNGDGYLEKRTVRLGDSNYEYIEVIEGIKPDEKVVVSNMSQYSDKNKIKINR